MVDLTRADLTRYMWEHGNLAWKLWPQQEPIYYGIRNLITPVELIVILCARQFGKSHLGVLLAIEDCIRYPDTCNLVIGPTVKQTTAIVAPRLKKIAEDAPPGLIKRTKSESKWTIGTSELVLGGFDQDSSSQRGKTLQNIYVEEVVDSDSDKYIESMASDLGPALTHSNGGRITFLTTPPKIPEHPFIVDTMVQAQLLETLYKYTIYDNIKLTEEQFNRCVKLAGGKNTIAFKREYECQIVRDPTVLVVPEFSMEKHVAPIRPPKDCHWHLTIDFGGVRDFTAAVLHTYDFLNDMDLVFDERKFPPNTPTNKIIQDLREMIAERGIEPFVYADVSGQLQIDLNNEHGFPVAIPPKTDWKTAVNTMAVRFSEEKLLIHPRCQFLISSCNNGTLNTNKTDFARTAALGHMDALAALMYGIRVRNTENPYKGRTSKSDAFFQRPKPDTTPQRLQAVTFGANTGGKYQPKKFGTFRK